MDTSIMINLSDPDFALKSFSEYSRRAVERYADLYSTFEDIISEVSVDVKFNQTAIAQEVLRVLNAVQERHPEIIPSTPIAVNGGYTTVTQLWGNFTKTFVEAIANNNATVDPQAYRFSIPKVNPVTGSMNVGNVSTTIQSFLDGMKANLHSIVCTAAASYAMEAKSKSAEWITIYNDFINRFFSDAYNDISNYSSVMRDLIAQSGDGVDFIRNVLSLSGITHEAEMSDSDSYTMSDSELFKRTGASPSSALDFSSATSALFTTVQAAANGVLAILKGLVDTTVGFVRYVANKFYQTTVNPDDLQLVNNSGFGTIDGFFFRESDISEAAYSIPVNVTYSNAQEMAANLNEKHDRWFAFKTLFGEYMYRWSNTSWRALRDGEVVSLKCDRSGLIAYYKPRLLNYEVLSQVITSTCATADAASIDEITSVLRNLQTLGPALYDTSHFSEYQKWLCLMASIGAAVKFNSAAAYAMTLGHTTFDISPNTLWNKTQFPWQRSIPSGFKVSNALWLASCCGWDSERKSFSDPFSAHRTIGVYGTNAPSNIFKFLLYGLAVAVPSENLVGSAAIWIPYSNNSTGWMEPSYQISTDAENVAAFNKFVNTCVLVTVLALVAVASVVVVKKISREIFVKRSQSLALLQSKMWSGEKLSTEEKYQFMRLTKKLGVSSVTSSGLNGSTFLSSVTQSSPTTDIMTEILRAIKG